MKLRSGCFGFFNNVKGMHSPFIAVALQLCIMVPACCDGANVLLYDGDDSCCVDGDGIPLKGSSKFTCASFGVKNESLPEKWDSRTYGWVSPVKDQGKYGTCWIFAALSTIETSLLKRNGTLVDLSEKHLANLHGWDHSPIVGGNANRAAAYLLRWEGPVMESDDPYPESGATEKEFGTSVARMPALHVQHMVTIPARSTVTDNAPLKKAVMKYGAVAARYYHLDNAKWRNRSTGGYYGNFTNDTNHVVTLVGWDDDYSATNFSTTPPADGAWIVKDSHGLNAGTNGYRYISYYDTSFGCKDSSVFIAANDDEDYDCVYGYDRLGRCNSRGTGNCGDKRYGAAVFETAGGAQTLEAIGFYATSDATEYEISVYTNCNSSSPVSGICVLNNQVGTTEFAGYTTVKLTQPIQLDAGVRFSVVLGLTTPGYGYQIAYEWATENASKAAARPGQTYYGWSKTNWEDFCNYKETASFCCKAYVRGQFKRVRETPERGREISSLNAWLEEKCGKWYESCGESGGALIGLSCVNGRSLWSNFVTGISPTNDCDLVAKIAIENGSPVVSWEPDLNEGCGKVGNRVYTIQGSKDMQYWYDVDGDEKEYNFFKVLVDLP